MNHPRPTASGFSGLSGARLVQVLLLLAVWSSLSACGHRQDLRGGPSRDGLSPTRAPVSLEVLDAAICRARESLRSRQDPGGYWCGTLVNDTSLTGVYVLLARYTGFVDPQREVKAVRFLMRAQGPDGGWEQYPGSGGNLDVTLINTVALVAAEVPPDGDCLARARAFIETRAGIERANFFTRIFLTSFGQISWSQAPWISCRLMHNRDFIYRQGFPRVILIPYMVLFENRKVLALPGAGPDRPSSLTFAAAMRLLRDDSGSRPPAKENQAGKDLEACVRWILERQEVDGTWGGVVQVTAFSAMALKSMDRPEYLPLIRRAVTGVESLQVEDAETLQQSFSTGPVMDTAHSLEALLLSGMSGTEASLQRALAWLAAQQSRVEGDWKVGNPDGVPGGWAFEFHNRRYPDVDDTSMVLHALSHLDPRALTPLYPEIDRGLDWVLSMQNWDGGFPVWDRNNWMIFGLLQRVFDVGDFSHEDVTARTLMMLSRMRALDRYENRSDIRKAIQRGRRYLLLASRGAPRWFGRWGANYTYGTGQVLAALMRTGSKPDALHVRRAVAWLFEVQNPDGGWGESLSSYESGRFEPGASTVAQSCSVLMGLLRAERQEDERFRQGIRYLLNQQQDDGSWQDHLFYAVNVPRAWYGRYELLPTQSALIVFASYRHRVHADAPEFPGPGGRVPGET